MNSLYHERPAPPNFLKAIESTSKSLLPATKLTQIHENTLLSTSYGQSKRNLESAASRITKDFSDPVPLHANEPNQFKLHLDDRHLGRQLNGFVQVGLSDSKKTKETQGDCFHCTIAVIIAPTTDSVVDYLCSGGKTLLGLFAVFPPLCLGDPYEKPIAPFKPGRQMQAFAGGGRSIHRGEIVGTRRLTGNLSNPPPLCLDDTYTRPHKGQPYLYGDPFGYITESAAYGGSGRYKGRQMGVSPPVPRSPVWGAAPERGFPVRSVGL